MSFLRKENIQKKINNQLKNMNIMPYDTVLINLNFYEFGLINKFSRHKYISLFKNYFKKKGTFISLAYTPSKFSLTNKNLSTFNVAQPSSTGAFANMMLKDRDSFRSSHPTNSIVAIGKNAKKISQKLNEKSGAYDFFREIINLDGKILIVGMQNNHLGFLTHLVEQDLKLYKQYWFRFFYEIKLNNVIFKRLDPGYCHNNHKMMFPYYIKNQAITTGRVGNGYALSIKAKKAYEIDYSIISKNPKILICTNTNCFKCRAGRWKTIWYLPFFIFKRVLNWII